MKKQRSSGLVLLALGALLLVAIVAPAVTFGDATSGSVVGTVACAGTGVPDITVNVTTLDGGDNYYATTGPDGSYSVDSVPNGGYVVSFQDLNDRYVDNASEGTTVTVAGATVTCNGSVVVAGHVAGRVSLDPTSLDGGGSVTAYTKRDGVWRQALTVDAEGLGIGWMTQTYSMGLKPGVYRLCFSNVDALPQCYPGVNTTDVADARCQDVTVTASATSTVDATLARGGHIVVTWAGPGALTTGGAAHIEIDTAAGDFVQHMWFYPGTEVLGGLLNQDPAVPSSDGQYIIRVWPATDAARKTLLDQYYDSQLSSATAIPVTVHDGQDTVITMHLLSPAVATTTKLKVLSSSVKKGKTLKLAGTVGPSGATGKVKVYLYRKIGKKWKPAGSAAVALKSGGYSYSFKPKYKGKWRFNANYLGAAPSYAASWSSGYATCTVK